jgi:cation-transporting ATPase E
MEDRPGSAPRSVVADESRDRTENVDPVNGLTQAEVRSRISAGDINASPPSTGRTLGQILRANVFTRFNAILGSLFVIALIIGPAQDALFGVVLVANTAIGIVQELRSRRALNRLAILAAPRTHAVRSGRVVDLPFEEIVVDDVLEVSRGDQVPVDGEVLVSEGLEVDESLLTGEAEAIAKSPGVPVLSGTFVVAGQGRIRATRVGESSYASGLEAQARRFSLIRSELQQGTNEILRLVTWVMIPTAIALFITQLLRSHQPSADALRGSVAGVAAMVPEGLVLLTSMAFTVGALRLARHRVLVQELAAVEVLARVDVLCIDKTGTLTEPGLQLEGVEPLAGRSQSEVEQVLAAVAASDPAPNATITALRHIGKPGSIDWPVQSRVAFSSARKWSAVEFAGHGRWILGAPQVVLRDRDEAVLARAAHHERAARRVLILATTSRPLESNELPESVEPVALVVFAERLRADASSTIRYLREQGMTVKVLSGDAPQTVSEVADRLSIPSPGPAVDATTLGGKTGLKSALDGSNLIGRVRPEQKLDAVGILQSEGHVVAMVGDGVNDVQALKQADLGIAMGSGSQSSRSVARVVLLDSAFSAVPRVLAEGRKVIANIERVANLFVNKTVYAALLAIAVILTAVPYPFFPRHLTIVSALTIGIPGFFLAFGSNAPRAEPGFMGRVLRFTIPAGVLTAAATFVSYEAARAAPDTSLTQARTAAVIAVFAVGLWVLVLIARPLDARRLLLVCAMAAIFVLAFAVPWSRRVFALQLPPSPVLAATVAVSLASIAALTFWRRFFAWRVGPAAAPTANRATEGGTGQP